MDHVSEPVRKSLLDVVQKNLQCAGRATYITRIIYIGEYHGTHESLGSKMETIINDLRSDYSNVITGFLLVYPHHYIHILEAPEDVLVKHFILMYRNNNDEYKFGKAISLPSYHHVNQRFFTEWHQVHTTVPPVLVEKLEANTLSDVMTQLTNCLIKIYTLCQHVTSTARDRSVAMADVLMHLGEKATQCLPESTMLQFFLKLTTPVVQSIQASLQIYMEPPLISFYNGKDMSLKLIPRIMRASAEVSYGEKK